MFFNLPIQTGKALLQVRSGTCPHTMALSMNVCALFRFMKYFRRITFTTTSLSLLGEVPAIFHSPPKIIRCR